METAPFEIDIDTGTKGGESSLRGIVRDATDF